MPKVSSGVAVRFFVTRAYCHDLGWPEPVAEYRFDPKRRWRFDIAFVEQKIAVELHGSVYVAGRHTRGKGFENDREKMNAAILAGWKVFELSTGQFDRGELWPLLDCALERSGETA